MALPQKAVSEITNLYQHHEGFEEARGAEEAEEPQGREELASQGLVSSLHPHLSTSIFSLLFVLHWFWGFY